MKGGGDGTFKAISTKVGMIQQFKCISSVIFLTHPIIINSFKRIQPIDKIYDASKNLLWSFGDGQNVTNMPMQTLHICLQQSELFSKILTLSNKHSDSFYNPVAIESNSGDFISSNLEELTPDSTAGTTGKVNSDQLLNNAPGKPYKKHTKAIVKQKLIPVVAQRAANGYEATVQ